MVKLIESDVQTTKTGFLKIFESFKRRDTTIQDAYYLTIEYCKLNNITPLYNSFDSFKSGALYKK